MDKNKDEDLIDKPPFFSSWTKLYAFVLLFELALIIFFLLITNQFSS